MTEIKSTKLKSVIGVQTRPYMEDIYSYKNKALLISGLGSFLGTLDSSIVNVSLPTISRELGTTIPMVGWVVLSYSIVIFSFLMIFGAISEKKGYQFNFKNGFLVFFIGSALCGVSTDIYMLIISRVIQGFGGAMLVSVGPALITRSHPPNERGAGLSKIAMVVSVGLMAGPPLGGFIIALAGWRWIFFVNLPVSLLAVYMTQRYLKDFPVTNPEKKISIPSSAALSMSSLCLMLAILLYSRNILELTNMLILLGISGMLLMSFVFLESKPKTKLIGLDIFRNRMFVFSGTAMLLVFISLTSISIMMPFYLEEVKKLVPEKVGLYLMTVPMCMFFVARLAGFLADRFQSRIISTIGILLLASGILMVRNLGFDSSGFRIVLALALAGVGMALFATPNTSSIMGSVKKYQLGVASGMIATLRTLGISLGVAFAVAIFSFYRLDYQNNAGDKMEAFLYGFRSVYGITIFVILTAGIFSLLRGKIFNRDKDSDL